jgi:hypothetical protein
MKRLLKLFVCWCVLALIAPAVALAQPPLGETDACPSECWIYDGDNSCEGDYPGEFEPQSITCATNGICDLFKNPVTCDSGQGVFFEFTYPLQIEWNRQRKKAKAPGPGKTGNFRHSQGDDDDCKYFCIERAKCLSTCEDFSDPPNFRCETDESSLEGLAIQDFVLNLQVTCTQPSTPSP